MCRNKLAYSEHQDIPACPDAVASGLPALRVLISDPSSFFSVFSVLSSEPRASRGGSGREIDLILSTHCLIATISALLIVIYNSID
jgi:hypothetical protein